MLFSWFSNENKHHCYVYTLEREEKERRERKEEGRRKEGMEEGKKEENEGEGRRQAWHVIVSGTENASEVTIAYV